jgi:hypothetical protein
MKTQQLPATTVELQKQFSLQTSKRKAANSTNTTVVYEIGMYDYCLQK